MATVTEVRRGFACQCPLCGEADVLRLDLSDCRTLTCGSCDGSLTVDELREIMAAWTRLLRWVDSAPEREDG